MVFLLLRCAGNALHVIHLLLASQVLQERQALSSCKHLVNNMHIIYIKRLWNDVASIRGCLNATFAKAYRMHSLHQPSAELVPSMCCTQHKIRRRHAEHSYKAMKVNMWLATTRPR